MSATTARSAIALAALAAGIGLLALANRGAGGPPADKPAAPSAAKPSTATADKAGAETREPKETPVERALGKRVSLHFDKTPLNDAAAAIGREQKINVLLDTKALTDAGVSLDTPVTVNVHDISLRSALRLMLNPLDLNYVLPEDADNVLLITSNEVAKNRLTTRVYPVADLAERGNEFSDEGPNFNAVIEAVTSNIAPITWDSAGGAGSVKVFGGSLVVSQTAEVHEQIADLIGILQEIRKQQQAAPGKVLLPLVDSTSQEEKICRALETRVDLDFDQTPLKDVADAIAAKQKIQIQIDAKALTDDGASADDPITFSLKQVKLGPALRRMLGEKDLNYYIDHEVLLITSSEVTKNKLRLVVYPVADLVGGSDEDSDEAYDQLIETITSTVVPSSWDSAGGAGSVTPLTVPKALIISQTQEILGQIDGLLAKLRAAKDSAAPAAGQAAEAADKPVVRVYQLTFPPPPAKPQPQAPAKPQPAPPAQAPAPAPGAAKPPAAANGPAPPPTLNQVGPPRPALGGGLFRPPPAAATTQPELDEDKLTEQYMEMIQKLIEPQSWKGQSVYIHTFPGRVIVVRQTPAVQRQIRKLLKALKVLEKPARGPSGGQIGGGIPVVG